MSSPETSLVLAVFGFVLLVIVLFCIFYVRPPSRRGPRGPTGGRGPRSFMELTTDTGLVVPTGINTMTAVLPVVAASAGDDITYDASTGEWTLHKSGLYSLSYNLRLTPLPWSNMNGTAEGSTGAPLFAWIEWTNNSTIAHIPAVSRYADSQTQIYLALGLTGETDQPGGADLAYFPAGAVLRLRLQTLHDGFLGTVITPGSDAWTHLTISLVQDHSPHNCSSSSSSSSSSC